jgi:hypothetical protein
MKMTLLTSLTLLMLAPATASAQDVIDHGPLHELLQRRVDKKGGVDYAGLKASAQDRAKLTAYLEAINKADPSKSSHHAQLAFYINTYNATVIASILDHMPLDSVMKVDGFFNKIEHPIIGQKMTLDHLENKIIRPTFKDARVHFVLVCGAVSCPPLQRIALTEKNVDVTLTRATRQFIQSSVTYDADKKTLSVSKLFEWFADDFKQDGGGSVHGFLAKYLAPKDETRAKLLKEAQLIFQEYDWALNAKKTDAPGVLP